MSQWIIDNNILISITISFLSFIVSIFLTVGIFCLQKKHEKEIEKVQVKYHEDKLDTEANIFLAENEKELEYLPLCVFASELHRHYKHIRKIYSEFCKCSDELQAAILKKANYQKEIRFHEKWFDKCITGLNADIQKLKLGQQLRLNDINLFNRAFLDYRNDIWFLNYKGDDTKLYSQSYIGLLLQAFPKGVSDYKIFGLFDTYLKEIMKYERFNDYRLGNKPTPPIDYLKGEIDLVDGSKQIVASGIIVSIISSICSIAKDYNLHPKSNFGCEHGELNISTFEDKFYMTVSDLYNIYGFENKKENIMGKNDSTKTRVTPLFDWIGADNDKLKNLLSLFQGPITGEPIRFGKLITPIYFGKKEKSIPPTRKHLKWCIDNIDKLTTYKDFGTKNPFTREKRKRLFTKDTEVIKEAYEYIYKKVHNTGWCIFEGYTHPDIYFETDNAIFIGEAKFTEPELTKETKWLTPRDQLIRHIDSVLDSKKQVYSFYVIDESNEHRYDMEAYKDVYYYKDNLPSRDMTESRKAMNTYIGYTTWQKIETLFR